MTDYIIKSVIISNEVNKPAFEIFGDDSILVEATGVLEAKQASGIQVTSASTAGVTKIAVAGLVKSHSSFAITESNVGNGLELTVAATGKVIYAPTIDSTLSLCAVLLGGHSKIFNDGYIYGKHSAIVLNARGSDEDLKIYNTGNIESFGITIRAYFGNDYIENRGSIKGLTIDLGSGSDTYDGSQGTTTCTIDLGLDDDKAYGGAGRETFIGGKGNDTLDGGGGEDTAVFSGASFNYKITDLGNHQFTIFDKRTYGPDGTDTLKNIRFGRFTGTGEKVAFWNTKPDNVTLDKTSVAENSLLNTPIATLSGHDADGDVLAYVLTDPTGTFKISGNSLVLVKALDYETKTSYSITVAATDKYSPSITQTFTIDVIDIADTEGTPGDPGKPTDAPLTLTGMSGADTLAGRGGNDLLSGLSGKDKLYGNGGNDKLFGGLGNDTLSGGLGQDVFVFDTKLAKTNTANKRYNLDRITDFNVADDTIHLTKGIFKGIAKTGVLSKGAFYAGTKSAAHDASDRIVYNKNTGAVLYDQDGSGHRYQAIQIAKLATKLGLTNKDFFVI